MRALASQSLLIATRMTNDKSNINLLIFQQVVQWLSYLCKGYDKPLIVGTESLKAPELRGGGHVY